MTRLQHTPGWSYRTADAPGTSLRFVIETHPAEWDRYAIQDDEGTRGDWVCYEPGYRRIAMTTDGGPEAEQDAAILASAMDLVNVVPRLLAVIEALMPGARHVAIQNYQELNEAPIAARAAIAKAKGGT